MRMLSGSFRESNSEANLLTEAMEMRSSSRTSILAPGILATMASLATSPAETLRTAMTTCTPRSTRTRAVSSPMPLVAPVRRALSSSAQHMPLFAVNNGNLRARLARQTGESWCRRRSSLQVRRPARPVVARSFQRPATPGWDARQLICTCDDGN